MYISIRKWIFFTRKYYKKNVKNNVRMKLQWNIIECKLNNKDMRVGVILGCIWMCMCMLCVCYVCVPVYMYVSYMCMYVEMEAAMRTQLQLERAQERERYEKLLAEKENYITAQVLLYCVETKDMYM